MSRPILSRLAQFHHDAWRELSAEQPMFSIGMGGALMPQRLSRVTARAEGVSLGMEGEELADFVVLLRGIDALEWHAALVRHGKRAAAEKKQNQSK